MHVYFVDRPQIKCVLEIVTLRFVDYNKINTKKMKFANNQIYHILVSLRAVKQRQTKWCQLISEKLIISKQSAVLPYY